MTTLSDGVTTLTISDDLAWPDEHAWQPVVQTVQPTLTGAIVVSLGTLQAGRPITLKGDVDEAGCLTRAQLDQCATWAAIAGRTLTLTLRGVARSVIFRHQDGAIQAAPLVPFNDVQAADYYVVTLRFMTI